MAKKKDPTLNPGGLYGGDVGSYAANQKPADYINALWGSAGLDASTVPPDMWRYLQTEGIPAIQSLYQNALAGNNQLGVKDWAKNAWGQELGNPGETVMNAPAAITPFSQPLGKRGKKKGGLGMGAVNNPLGPGAGVGGVGGAPPKPPGSGLGIPGAKTGNMMDAQSVQDANNMFFNFLAQDQPQDYFGKEAQRSGLITPDSASDYVQFIRNQFFQSKYGDYLNERETKPGLGFRQFV